LQDFFDFRNSALYLNLFVAGGVIAGKDTAPIFIENGRFHGKKIAEAISTAGVDIIVT